MPHAPAFPTNQVIPPPTLLLMSRRACSLTPVGQPFFFFLCCYAFCRTGPVLRLTERRSWFSGDWVGVNREGRAAGGERPFVTHLARGCCSPSTDSSKRERTPTRTDTLQRRPRPIPTHDSDSIPKNKRVTTPRSLTRQSPSHSAPPVPQVLHSSVLVPQCNRRSRRSRPR